MMVGAAVYDPVWVNKFLNAIGAGFYVDQKAIVKLPILLTFFFFGCVGHGFSHGGAGAQSHFGLVHNNGGELAQNAWCGALDLGYATAIWDSSGCGCSG